MGSVHGARAAKSRLRSQYRVREPAGRRPTLRRRFAEMSRSAPRWRLRYTGQCRAPGPNTIISASRSIALRAARCATQARPADRCPTSRAAMRAQRAVRQHQRRAAICRRCSEPRVDANGQVKDIDVQWIRMPTASPGFPNCQPDRDPVARLCGGDAEKGPPLSTSMSLTSTIAFRCPLRSGHEPADRQPAFGPAKRIFAQLKAYDVAFASSSRRLAAHGITKDNTLFLVVPDENDHSSAASPSPLAATGPCTPALHADREITRSSSPADTSARTRRRSRSTATTRRPSTWREIRPDGRGDAYARTGLNLLIATNRSRPVSTDCRHFWPTRPK